jgi:hypothetical protein
MPVHSFHDAHPAVDFQERPASGTGAWEAALVNTLSPGDEVVCFETGHFSTLWREMAGRLGLNVRFLPVEWRHGASPEALADVLAQDSAQRIGFDLHGHRRKYIEQEVLPVARELGIGIVPY